MASFELIYEEDEDVLEVTFTTFDEQFAQAISLNEYILLHADPSLSVAWGLTFYSFSRLIEVSETHLDGLIPLPEANSRRVLRLLGTAPANHFLEIRDPAGLVAVVKTPHLADLLAG